MSQLYKDISQLGEYINEKISSLFSQLTLLLRLFFYLLKLFLQKDKLNKTIINQTIFQILFTGVEAIPLITLIALITGFGTILQSITNMPQFGIGEYFGKIVIIILRDLGPIIVSIIIVARSGTAFSVFIGNMKVNNEIAALEAMGIDPEKYLILPSFIGMTISNIALNIYFGIIASLGGLLIVTILFKIPFMIFFIKIYDSLKFYDVFSLILKGTISGIIIPTISGYFGMGVTNIREVSMSVIKSVVVNLFYLSIILGILTGVSYL